jgi:hypothetical protein
MRRVLFGFAPFFNLSWKQTAACGQVSSPIFYIVSLMTRRRGYRAREHVPLRSLLH